MTETTLNDSGKLYRVGAKRRRRRAWVWPVVALILAAAAAGVFLLVESSRGVSLASISPAPDSLLNTQSLTISAELSGYQPGRGALSVTLDGQPVAAGDLVLQPGAVQARVTVADGPHTVALSYDAHTVLTHRVDRTWQFTIDTAAPQVAVKSPATFPRLGARSSAVAFSVSEAGKATLTLDGTDVEVDAGTAGLLKATIVAAEGPHVLVLHALDNAGNGTTRQWDLMVDSQPPALAAEGLPDGELWNDLNFASIAIIVSDRFAAETQVIATIDGVQATLQDQESKSAGKRKLAFETGTLSEGTHTIEITATDPGGHAATIKRDFLVDTSSTFGARTMKAGAQGDDVKQLQRILKIKGAYDGDPTGMFDSATEEAVEAFNSQHGVAAGGAVTEQTLKFLLGYIRIDVSERKLYLYDGDDRLLKTYGVAVGMPAYPTPIGKFRIITKAKNPTWNPPDSAWAAGMGPVPPGPENPLGTRWMGLNSPGIGIHGTPAPSSIGTAASHGCIRMRIPEVEDLFDRVFVGTPVEIVK